MTEANKRTLRQGFSRRSFTSGMAAAAMAAPFSFAAPAVANAAAAPAKTPAETVGEPEAKAMAPGRRMTLYAEELPDGEMGYGLEPGKASIPGPLIEMIEGETLHIELVNTLDGDVSLHVHGLDYEITSDGTAMNDSVVKPGGKRTYTWRTHTAGRRDDGTWEPGSAGYWHYHDHIVGTKHGTGGLRKGLYGPVVVRRVGDILPEKQFTIVFNDNTINNRVAPDAPDFEAKTGERVEIIMITHGEFYHTFHMHGHRWVDNRTGMIMSADDETRVIDNKICGPADSFGFQIIAGERVGPGKWMYHCHVQSHSDMGMVGNFIVTD